MSFHNIRGTHDKEKNDMSMTFGLNRPEDPPAGAVAMRDLLMHNDGHARCRYQCLICKYSVEVTLENEFQVTMIMENHLADVHGLDGDFELTDPPEFLLTTLQFITSYERQYYVPVSR